MDNQEFEKSLEPFLYLTPPTTGVFTLEFKNNCTIDMNVVIKRIAARFINDDGTDFIKESAVTIYAQEKQSLVSNDASKCVSLVIAALTVSIPNRPDQILTGQSASKPGMCGDYAIFSVNPKPSVRSTNADDILELINTK
jgi:hypothetical protein